MTQTIKQFLIHKNNYIIFFYDTLRSHDPCIAPLSQYKKICYSSPQRWFSAMDESSLFRGCAVVIDCDDSMNFIYFAPLVSYKNLFYFVVTLQYVWIIPVVFSVLPAVFSTTSFHHPSASLLLFFFIIHGDAVASLHLRFDYPLAKNDLLPFALTFIYTKPSDII